jgi:hypothetical protein
MDIVKPHFWQYLVPVARLRYEQYVNRENSRIIFDA